MPKTKQQKKEIIDRTADKIKQAKFLVFTSFSRRGKKGLNFPAMEKLKKNLKEKKAEYVVLKKTLLDLALGKSSIASEVRAKDMEGSVAVLIGYEDAIEPMKILHKLSKENEALVYYFGFNLEDKKIMPKDLLVEFANLQPLEILLVRLYNTIRFPLWKLAIALTSLT